MNRKILLSESEIPTHGYNIVVHTELSQAEIDASLNELTTPEIGR